MTRMMLTAVLVGMVGSTTQGQAPQTVATTTTVLPTQKPDGDGLEIVGPDTAKPGDYVHLKVVGLPPVDGSMTIDEALEWLKTISLRVQQPPESEEVDFDVTLGFDPYPNLTWKLTLDLRATVSGDYVVVFAMPAEQADEPVQVALHRVRYGEGPVPPPPPPPDPDMEVTPDDAFSSKGPPGGPFEPPTKGYVIQNVGKGQLNWSVNTRPGWLTAEPDRGVIAAGGSEEVFLGFGPEAEELKAGVYAGAASFQNLSNGRGNTHRLIALRVEGEPPPPPVQELWGLLIHESENVDDLGPEFARVLYSQRLRDLGPKFHWEPREVDEKDPDGNTPPDLRAWLDVVEKEDLPLPHLFLVDQDGNSVANRPVFCENCVPDESLNSVDEVMDFIRDYLPED